MKKIFRAALAAAAACVSAFIITISAAAETEDFEAPLNKVKTTNGDWGQSLTLDVNDFDCTRITPDSVVTVEYTVDGEPASANLAPVELILFNYTEERDRIWAKIEPFEYDETSASFDYETMILRYGSDDLSTVDNLCIGDTGAPITVTKLVITNCTVSETTTTTAETTVSTTAETDPPETAAPETSAPETTEAVTTAPATAEESGGVPIVLIVVITVVVAVAVVATIIILKNKRRFY